MLADLENDDSFSSDEEKPSWLKLKNGETKRIAFLSAGMTKQLVYSLEDLNADPKTNRFRGSFKSITAELVGSRDKIKNLIQAGDPEGQLKVDVKTFNKPPSLLAAMPVFVYPLNEDGAVDEDVLKAKGFKIQMLMITVSRYFEFKNILKKLKRKKLKLTDVDFELSKPQTTNTWKIEALTDEVSLFSKHKTKFDSVVIKKLDHEYKRLGVKDLDTFGSQYVGFNLNEQGWANKLTEYGYIKDVVKKKAQSSVAEVPGSNMKEEEMFPDEENIDF